MSELYRKSLLKLELDRILTMLSECAGSVEGKTECMQIDPVSDLDTVNELLAETSDAYDLSTVKGYPGFSSNLNVSESISRANIGGVLQPKELLQIASVLRCTRNVKDYFTDDLDDSSISGYFHALVPNKYLEDRIYAAFPSEDEVADAASPALADIRRHIRQQSNKIRESLQKIITSPTYSKALRESIITIRQGRYVVPVKSECKNDIPGLVHDVSATGSTYFIEPMSAVEANNALRELELQEQSEIARILAEFSGQISNLSEEIMENCRYLIKLDVIFAKARLAYKMKACAPIMNNQGKLSLRNARHPLIDQKVVVPVSVHLGTDFDTMIITGPNTGGKTVTLKTVGLLTLMAECGLFVPAGDGSVLSTFDAVLADIGDEQSISQSLSTFSSHMKTIVDVIDQCDNRTLVLFDELGAGTDPAEGAALAISLIEFCRKMGSNVLATTHYAELKLYAMRTKGVINASCEFNVETLQPTYKLLIGVPGKSNAFAISRRLGLPEDILKHAADLVSENDRDFDDVLSQLEDQRIQMENARAEAEYLRAETEKIKKSSEHYQSQMQQEQDRILEQARNEARTIIEDARRVANEAENEIKAIKKQISQNSDLTGVNQRKTSIRKSLNDAESRLNTERTVKHRPKPSRDIIIGDTVELLKLGTKANVIAINKDGSYQLQAGILKLTAKADEVYLLEQNDPYVAKGGRPAHSGREMKMSAMSSEIDLRGMDSVEAICVLERYMDEAMRANLPSVRIIHGKGTGVLRTAVQQSLKRNKFVKKFRLGIYGEGEDGVTIAEFS